MKNLKRKGAIASIWVLTGVAALILVSCSGSDTTAVSVVAPEVKSVLQVAFQTIVQDANTGLPITLSGTEKITLAVYGTDAEKIIDGDGASLYSAANKFAGPITSSNGIFTIYLKPGLVPSDLTLRMVANAKGYVTSSREVLISKNDLKTDGTTSSFDVLIKLINQTEPPATVVIATEQVPLAAGVTPASPISVTTPVSVATVDDAEVKLGTAKVIVPASTTAFSDAAKTKPLPSGTTSLVVTYNNNTTGTSLAAFPGGLLTRQDTEGNALASPGGFISGGLASIELNSTAADGTVTKAKTFDKPLDVTISIPKATVNPVTGNLVAPGDIIPIWSYDTTTGEWSVMKLNNGNVISGTLGALDSNNTYPVTFQTDHLSYFNLDWFYWKTKIPGKQNIGQCDSAPITIKGAQGKYLYLEASMDGGGWMHPFYLDADTKAPASVTSQITYAPKNLKMTIKAYLGSNSAVAANLVGTVNVADVCSGVTLDVTAGVAALSPKIAYAPLEVKAQEVCSNNTALTTAVPSDGVYAAASGLPIMTAITNSVGVGSLTGLVVGKKYQISVKNRDNQLQARDYTVVAGTNPQQLFSFPVTCKSPTGATGAAGAGS